MDVAVLSLLRSVPPVGCAGGAPRRSVKSPAPAPKSGASDGHIDFASQAFLLRQSPLLNTVTCEVWMRAMAAAPARHDATGAPATGHRLPHRQRHNRKQRPVAGNAPWPAA